MGESRGRRLYDQLPAGLQDLALTLFGIRNRARLRAWSRILASFEASEYWTDDQQVEYVAERLRTVLAHAVRYVPHHHDLAYLLPDLERGDSPVFEMLELFPPTRRSDVARDPGAFISRAFDAGRLKAMHTSGTTGTPLTTWLEPRALLIGDALAWRRTIWAGFEDGDWIARLVGDPVIPLSAKSPRRVFRVSWTDRRLYFSTFHLSATTAPKMARALLSRRPAFLMGYPSALDSFVRLCRDKVDLSPWKPRAVLFSSEPLYEHQREMIAGAIDAPQFGFYGCAERVVSAAQCAHGSYHLNLVDGFVEGQFGYRAAHEATYVTGLLNRAMPLVRYELGDTITPLVGERCGCGRTLPVIDPVLTKLEDAVETPSGRSISPSSLTWAFKDLPRLRRSQIVQRTATSLDVWLETDPEDFPRIRSTLEHRLDEMLFHELRIEFHRKDDLELTRAGKSRFVISEIP
jgi:phenylacetate-CoA ligase